MGSFQETNLPRPFPKLSDSIFKMFDLHGKVAITTGGSGGIDYEAARALAEAGADVIVPTLSGMKAITRRLTATDRSGTTAPQTPTSSPPPSRRNSVSKLKHIDVPP